MTGFLRCPVRTPVDCVREMGHEGEHRGRGER